MHIMISIYFRFFCIQIFWITISIENRLVFQGCEMDKSWCWGEFMSCFRYYQLSGLKTSKCYVRRIIFTALWSYLLNQVVDWKPVVWLFFTQLPAGILIKKLCLIKNASFAQLLPWLNKFFEPISHSGWRCWETRI
jgi:hypothetical protein